MLSRTEIERIAAATGALRPDWPVRSLITFITADLASWAYRDAMVALAWIACDPTTQTPKRVLESGPWRRAAVVDTSQTVSQLVTRCAHGSDAARCADCNPSDRPDPEVTRRGKASALAALRGAPGYRTPKPRTEPQPSDLSAARTRADREAS